ncbi:leucyl aminopeptidase [Tahibacter aquaticus]|uniref:Leucyl aminopeptidase n=1 Tax=Tahibacter aquaticus TaxID=520092 RepID=A0A4R6YVB1_9GAMM|nr:M20/M25/M40 family metallo-hydrolase [Tahibacter aquaticus]TDR42570.1 leucyl aminopeptidase [Tahibacter aquaticus]
MTLHHRLLLSISAALLGAAVCPSTLLAQADTPRAGYDAERDPFAAVFIVTSRDTYKGIADLAHSAAEMRDSSGTGLVIAQAENGRLSEMTARIHEKELRCGGYFAFRTRAEAEAFVRADRSGTIARQLLAADYSIDNQTTVNPWLGSAREADIRATITQLSSYKNRYYSSSYGRAAAEGIRNQWAGLIGSRTDATADLYTACTNCSTQPSVILTIQGNELASEVVVLGAHLDSINTAGNGSTEQTAPGADDDASGVASLTEVIRVALASGWKPRRTVKFMAYAGEEVGLRGSNSIAQSFKNSNVNVVGVMQLDMTNYKAGSGPDMRLITDFSNETIKDFLVRLFDAYLAPRGYTRGTYTCGYGCSDHASWSSAGYPSAMMFEAGNSSGGYFGSIHSANDTLANMGATAQNSVKFTQLGLAFLGELGKTSGGVTPPVNVPPVASFSSSFNGLAGTFTDTSSDSDGSIAARSWTFGDGSSSTATNPAKTYAAGGTYTVTLTVTDNKGATNAKSSPVTVVAGAGGNALSNGVARTGIGGARNSSQVFTLVVPAGARNLKFVTSGGSGDADLYAKLGSAPTTTSYTCRSEGGTNSETCTITNVQAGTYHVLVYGYAAYSGLSLTGSYTP